MSPTSDELLLLSEVKIYVDAKKAADGQPAHERIKLLEEAIRCLKELGAHPEFVDVLEHDLAAAKEAARSLK